MTQDQIDEAYLRNKKVAENERRVMMFKFCPVCGKELETPPISGLPACFVHGDVILRADEVVFRLFRNI